jgi:23S rRNA (cytosine1962-C5)-methyltransferase
MTASPPGQSPTALNPEAVSLLRPTGWRDYELLDSGDGAKLERFGPYVIERPEQQAIWRRSLPAEDWERADAYFDESGNWQTRREMPERWTMRWNDLQFYAELTPFRHTGIFPEQAANWVWFRRLIESAGRPVRVLNLFGYTGLATLVALAAGAEVTHVDASRPSLAWAKDNVALSRLEDRPIRWMLDDALKFVRREGRRGSYYEGVIMDPPVFGRGPHGELWRFFPSFPPLVEACRAVLSDDPLFFVVNAYAVDASAVMLQNVLVDILGGLGGTIEAGELVVPQRSRAPAGAERLLSTGIVARWSRDGDARRARRR